MALKTEIENIPGDMTAKLRVFRLWNID